MTGLWGIKYGNSKVSEVTTIVKKSGRKGRGKGRSLVTYQNKLRKLEKIYKNLAKASKKAKEKGKARSFYFHEKYPSFKQYNKILNIKEASK